ncbi:MAG: hypothetical protein ABSF60_14725 [Verrucomicrobiota bacterium]|jgi:hypothetical protein
MKKLLFAVAIVATCHLSPVQAQEVVPQTQLVLKSYFQPHYQPTSTNFYELIDTLFWYINSTYTNSQAALSNSITSVNSLPYNASSSFRLDTTTPITSYNTNNCVISGFHYSSGTWLVTNTFITPFADTNYMINTISKNVGLLDFYTVPVQKTNYCVFQFAAGSGYESRDPFCFVNFFYK